MSFSDKPDFDIKTRTSNNSLSCCLWLKYSNQADEDLHAFCQCDNWYHCEYLNIDEKLLMQIPEFICKQCYNYNLIPFAAFILLNYQLGHDLTIER